MKPVMINERGLRIGESHPSAKLTDAEVAQLLRDRDGGMSLRKLGLKWGLSKSGVKSIVDGRSRYQAGKRILAKATRAVPFKRVRVTLVIGLHHRAKLHRLGGRRWIEMMIDKERGRAPE
jgi:lambda repressor-like predicted transcriptional regulator